MVVKLLPAVVLADAGLRPARFLLDHGADEPGHAVLPWLVGRYTGVLGALGLGLDGRHADDVALVDDAHFRLPLANIEAATGDPRPNWLDRAGAAPGADMFDPPADVHTTAAAVPGVLAAGPNIVPSELNRTLPPLGQLGR